MTKIRKALSIEIKTDNIISKLTEGFEGEILVILEKDLEDVDANEDKETLFTQKLIVVRENINEYVKFALSIIQNLNINASPENQEEEIKTLLETIILLYIVQALLTDHLYDDKELTYDDRKTLFFRLFPREELRAAHPNPKIENAIRVVCKMKENLYKEIEKIANDDKQSQDTKEMIKRSIKRMFKIMTTEREFKKNTNEPLKLISSLDEYLDINSPTMGVGNIILITCLTLDVSPDKDILEAIKSLDRYLRIFNDLKTHYREDKLTALKFVQNDHEINDIIKQQEEASLEKIKLIKPETIRELAINIHRSITKQYSNGEFERTTKR